MEELQIERFKKMISEVVQEGFGEVNFRVLVKDSKIDLISLTKINNYKIDARLKKEYF